MNISRPVVAVTAKARHVHFRTSEATAENGRRVDARPRSRRSTMTIVPNTIVKPRTWTDSIRGNRYSEFRMLVASAEVSSQASRPAIPIYPFRDVDQDPHT